MKHYLVTQWNCDLYDLDWLKRRQVVFERFCLPSVESQTTKDFEWVLVSDSRTPDEFKNVLDSYPATVIYHDFENYEWKAPDVSKLSEIMQLSTRLEYIQDIVADFIGEQDTDYIITSRCDNDDSISLDHIERTQYHA
ncbi:MAG: glycosyltransferase, partial [Candidatus Thorarchaeota archaeon]